MSQQIKQDVEVLRALKNQIEDILKHFKVIRNEAATIAQNSNVPDAALHLNDVLESTEQAAMTIIDAAGHITTAVDGSSAADEVKQKVADEIGRIYEASSFQDISGQRIKKVLTHLTTLETQLQRLSDTAKGQAIPQKTGDPLLNGPQLASEAPTQEEVDRMFKESGN